MQGTAAQGVKRKRPLVRDDELDSLFLKVSTRRRAELAAKRTRPSDRIYACIGKIMLAWDNYFSEISSC